ncbi:a-factor receptor [Collariella sp. IMI 366227]|nr:a-factor receptor [Collariella sp. IMI 366227]
MLHGPQLLRSIWRQPPYNSIALRINLFFRVALGLTSLFVTWIPAKLLWRNGEFAGTVFCVTLLVINFFTVINALIWHDNDVDKWWDGHGWCDFQVYIQFAIHSAFNISLFEIMRGLASKVAFNRAVKPTRSERRRERIVSALVIFTVPFLQVVLHYFAAFTRYNVSTLVGCTPNYLPTWIALVFYVIPIPVFAVAAAIMACVTFHRYRKVEKITREISRSQGAIAAARQDRVRKKLYFITLVAIIFVLPLTTTMMVFYILDAMPLERYDFHSLHVGPNPFNSSFINFTTSHKMGFSKLATDFVAEVAGIFVFIPFGTTPEALNMYRKILLNAGLGYVFPSLRSEYEPSPTAGFKFSWGSISLKGKSLLASL